VLVHLVGVLEMDWQMWELVELLGQMLHAQQKAIVIFWLNVTRTHLLLEDVHKVTVRDLVEDALDSREPLDFAKFASMSMQQVVRRHVLLDHQELTLDV
jgi:hypothetical protein